MPVTSVGFSSVARPSSGPPAPAPAATPAPGPAPAPAAAAGAPAAAGVGHGVTRLKSYTQSQPFIPGTPPPRGETAGAHGAHKGRISVR